MTSTPLHSANKIVWFRHSANKIVWFRRDLRLDDNKALQAAIRSGGQVLCVYIRQPDDRFAGAQGAAQAWWLHQSLISLARDIERRGNRLILATGSSMAVLQDLITTHNVDEIFWNRRYDPDGVAQDTLIKQDLKDQGLRVASFSGQLLHEPGKLLNKSGLPYKVYTPFWRAIEASGEPDLPFDGPEKIPAPQVFPDSESLDGWKLTPKNPNWAARFGEIWQPGESGAKQKLDAFIDGAIAGYKTGRDFPHQSHTSRLSPHLALGEIAPARLWHATTQLPDNVAMDDVVQFRKELVWRDFSWHLLFHHPDLASVNLNRRFDAFAWADDSEKFDRWKKGMTGYPIVDAGMRQLWQHGWMHNRVRMVTASFLIKHLMLDWRLGERWFRSTLVDADPASNAASWQWVAGSGADAAPFYRIFSPMRQGETFDPDGEYIRAFVPELGALPNQYIHTPFDAPAEILATAGVRLGQDYPAPIVDHFLARNHALAAFKALKEQA